MIVEHIGVPALLEQLAEECCELAQASLKMARKLRDENPTPKSIEDIRDNLVEEIADVDVCLDRIEDETDIVDRVKLATIENDKKKRWRERLEQHADIDFEEIFKQGGEVEYLFDRYLEEREMAVVPENVIKAMKEAKASVTIPKLTFQIEHKPDGSMIAQISSKSKKKLEL